MTYIVKIVRQQTNEENELISWITHYGEGFTQNSSKELGISLVNVFLSALWWDRNILHNNNGYFNTPHQN